MSCQPLTELSLFSGAGGGILGSLLLGHRIVGAVELNEYCCRVLEQRQRDGHLQPFPIFQTDIRDFVRSGYASLYKGHCDLVSAGFPCQPFSVAGNQAGSDDERNMWPATADVIRAVQPQSVLLENVPGLISCGYLGTVVSDLAALGYVGRWGVIGARDCGAPHKRDRLWIVAHTTGQRDSRGGVNGNGGKHQEAAWQFRGIGISADMANTSGERCEESHNAASGRELGQHSRRDNSWWLCDPGDVPESGVGRVASRVAYGMDRIKAIGNGQCSAVVRRAWEVLA